MNRYPITGSVQEKKGRFYLSINTYENGVRKPTSIPTGLIVEGNRKKAEAMLTDVLAKYARNMITESERQERGVLFSEYLQIWLRDKKASVELSTWENYQTCVECHLAPYYAEKKLILQELSRKHIKEYYNYKAHNGRKDGKLGGLSNDTMTKHASVLKMALDEAVVMELIPYNPSLNVPTTKVRVDEVERHYLSWSEAKELLQLMQGHTLYPIVYTALYLGLRRSEILGLRWDCVKIGLKIFSRKKQDSATTLSLLFHILTIAHILFQIQTRFKILIHR